MTFLKCVFVFLLISFVAGVVVTIYQKATKKHEEGTDTQGTGIWAVIYYIGSAVIIFFMLNLLFGYNITDML